MNRPTISFWYFLLASKFPRFRRSVCCAAAAGCWAPACFDQYANRAFLCMISQRDSNLLTQKVELSVARPESREFVFRFPLIVIQHEFVDSYIDVDVISGLPLLHSRERIYIHKKRPMWIYLKNHLLIHVTLSAVHRVNMCAAENFFFFNLARFNYAFSLFDCSYQTIMAWWRSYYSEFFCLNFFLFEDFLKTTKNNNNNNNGAATTTIHLMHA